VPAANGDPGTGTKTPFPVVIANAAMLPGPLPEQSAPQLGTYRNLPVGSMATEMAPDAAGNGEPGIGVREPSEAIEYPETSLDRTLATYRNLPEGSTAVPAGFRPAANGEPGSALSVPLAATLYAEMVSSR